MAAKGTSQAFVRLRSQKDGEWFVHPDLRPRLVAEAAERGTSLNDVCMRILCSHFNVPYVPSGKESQPKEDKDVLLISMTPVLVRAVALSYPKRPYDGVRYVLCSHYGLRVPPKVKKTRARRSAPATA